MKEWLALVERALDHAAAIYGTSGVANRNILFALWMAAYRAPPAIRDLYRAFDEDQLTRDAEEFSAKSLFANIPRTVGSLSECGELLLALAVRIRYLEGLLLEVADNAPIRSGSQCLVKFDSEEGFFLPRKPRHRIAATRQSFRRRGLQASRILPRRIGDYRVTLFAPDDPSGRDRAALPGDLGFGTGLFKDLRFVERQDKKGFFIEDVKVPDQIATIGSQITGASQSGCTGVVYPELTISRAALADIQNRLVSDWDCKLSLIVAGSRHESIGTQRFNVCSILNAYGEEIGQHRKLYRYSDGSKKPGESIEVGDELQILVMPDALFAFGICLDFCNTSEDPPYAELDVDYVLVPSCGNDSTMQGHIQRASEYLSKQKTRTLVVQQFYSDKPKTGDPLGYVLARVSGEAPRVSETKSNEIWSISNI